MNPDPYGRIFERESPFKIDPIACSRIPKWKLRPPRVFALKSPAPSTVSRVFVERLAVRGVRVLLVRRTPGDVAVDDDQRRPIVSRLRRLQRALEHLEIVCVADAGHVPAVGDEAGRDVLGERPLGMALDRDL